MRIQSIVVVCVSTLITTINAFQNIAVVSIQNRLVHNELLLNMAVTTDDSTKTQTTQKKAGYEPKWKKIQTLAEQQGSSGTTNFAEIGLKGTIPVVFRQGGTNRTTMAIPNQPIREVAIQAGQFIKYGCGKGECGTCECTILQHDIVGSATGTSPKLLTIRPCSTNIPIELLTGQSEIIINVPDIKYKSKSSGKFYSIKSFFMGFKNNLLGMIGFIKYRKNAKQNWQERQDYEALIKQRTLEKKLAKQQQQLSVQQTQTNGGGASNKVSSSKTNNGLKP